MSTTEVDQLTQQLSKTKVHSTRILSFAGRSIKLDCAKDADEIVKAIKDAKVLTGLNLEGNTLGVDAAQEIGNALEGHKEFQRALWSDMFTGRLKTEIPPALKHLSHGIMTAGAQLVELDLSDNAFGPNGMIGLTELLTSSSCYTLEALKLNNNGLGVTGGKMLAESLMKCHHSSTAAGRPLKLRVFVSGRGRLENEGATALSEVFKVMGSLEKVSMPQNGINHQGITALADAFASNKNLREVSLNDNTFTEIGAKSMAKALPNLQNLEIINFDDCLVRTEGAKAIADALTNGHKKLQKLLMNFNEIKAAGATALADAMDEKEDLESFGLNGNELGEEGIELVVGTMQALGKPDVLAEFDDDEGDDEDDEGGSGEEDNEEEDEGGEELDDPGLQVTGTAITPRSEPKSATIEEFMLFPSPTKLKAARSNPEQSIVKYLGLSNEHSTEDVDKAVKTIVKLSAAVSTTDPSSLKAACDWADEIMKQLSQGQQENFASLLSNSFLVYLGLIKSEDKIAAPSDISGALQVMNHLVQQSYFPKSAKDILSTFISRPHPLLQTGSAMTHQNTLLQTLYH